MSFFENQATPVIPERVMMGR